MYWKNEVRIIEISNKLLFSVIKKIIRNNAPLKYDFKHNLHIAISVMKMYL